MSKKLGFALGAGGARGIAHIGFLECMEANGIFPDVVSGCSMGSVVGALYCKGVPFSTMLEEIDEMKLHDLVDFNPNFFFSAGLNKGEKVHTLLKYFLGDTDLKDLRLPFACNSVDLVGAKEVWLTEGPAWRAVAASSCIPLVFQPLEVDGMLLVDGGLLNRVPARLCRSLGADLVLGVDVSAYLAPEYESKNLVSDALRAYNIVERRMTELLEDNCDFFLPVIQPDVDAMHVKNLHASYEYGKKAAEEALPKIRKFLEENGWTPHREVNAQAEE